jgi:radical SAM protein with 4Fe4S-binding SPASM domain
VREKSFAEIWKNAPLLNEFRGPERNIKGVCGSCGYQKICGGCRGRAYAHTADHHAADPACLLKK